MLSHKNLLVWLVVFVFSAATSPMQGDPSTQVDIGHGRMENRLVLRNRRGIKDKIDFLALIGQLYTEQREDQDAAFRKISDLVNNNFAPEPSSESNSTTTTRSRSTAGSDGDGTTTTSSPSTTSPYRATRSELLGIVRKNLLGLNKLMMKEWRMAMKDSKKNSAAAITEFKDSVRPFLVKNSTALRG